jgi:alpha-tubulin suppressor-like RCC1 family protein
MLAVRRVYRASLLLSAPLFLSCSESPTEGNQTRIPASLDIVAGDGQDGIVGTELPNPLVVRVEDANGLPVIGQLVNFRVTAGGGSVFAGSGLTNALGIVQDRWTLGTSTAEIQRVEARAVDANSGAAIVFATFRATPLPGPAHSLAKAGGDAQTGALGAPLTDSLAARVTDSFGNPVPNVQVTWTASVNNGAVPPATSQTNAQGIAKTRWTLGSRLDVPHSVTATAGTLAPATFSVTPNLPSNATIVKLAGDGTTATVGTAMAESLAVRVQLADGRVVAGAQVSWNVTSAGGGVAPGSSVTQADGVTRARLTLGTGAGANVVTAAVSGITPATFTVTGTPDVPASLTKVSGDGQTGTVGQPLSAPLIVHVTDRFGNSVPNATVTWTVNSGGGSVANTSVTNAQGRASMQWTLGGSSGSQRVVASIGSTTVEFAATAGSGSLASVRVSPDSLRFGSLNSSSRLVARAFDQFGNELSSVTFTWFGPNGAVATVDANGLVTSRGNGSTWIGARSGSFADSIPVTVRQVTYTLHVSPPSAGVIVGDTTRYVGTALDTVGHRIPDAPIAWTTSNGTIATVDGTGLVRGIRAGETWVVVQSEGARDSARVIVLGSLVAERVSAGFWHSCAIAEGTRAFCWGTNVFGQLGKGMTDGDVHTPALVVGNHSFAGIDASLQTTCALEGSTPYCWGNMVSPIPGLPRSATPVARSEIAFTQITHGHRHACGLTAAGKAYCWGDNDRGQLGTDTTLSDSIPRAVVGNLTFASISAGGRLTCGLTTAGEAYCWGNNEYGELGVGSRDESGERCNASDGSYVCLKRPTRVAGGHVFSAISAGYLHACAIRSGDGALYCWGLNDYGQLGTGPVVVNCVNRFGGRFACEPSPVAVGDGRTYASVSAGYYQTCAIAVDNSGLCWGRNEAGQLGRTTTEQCTDVSGTFTPCGVTPGVVSGGLAFRGIDPGYLHSCGVTVAREIYCWGDNQYASLGQGRGHKEASLLGALAWRSSAGRDNRRIKRRCAAGRPHSRTFR